MVRKLTRRNMLALCLSISLSPALADETPLSRAQAVIRAQIEAFLADDADKAYSFASPAIRKIFPDRDTFFQMVKRRYAPVYRPGNYAFGRSRVSSDGANVLQEVLISVSEGKDWSAIYELEREPDGSYRINGVQMLENTNSKGI